MVEWSKKGPENVFILFRHKFCEDHQQVEGASESCVKANGPLDTSQQWKSLFPEAGQYWQQLAKDKEHEQIVPNYVYGPHVPRRPQNEH